MGNVLRVLKRDTIRLLKAPAAMIVVMVLLVLPSLYTWYNVLGFWDPYSNTGNLRVGVVNEDAGVENDLVGRLNVGDSVVDALMQNSELEWVVEDRDAAMDHLKSGDLYAVYVIPSNFSQCIVSPLTGQLAHPQLQYYVNEKLGPVSPKITDAGASTLEQVINSRFVQTVSDVSVQVVDQKLQDTGAKLDASKSEVSTRLAQARDSVADVRGALGEIDAATRDAQGKVASARDALDGAGKTLEDSTKVLSDVSQQAKEAQSGLSSASTDGLSKMSSFLGTVSNVSAQANTAAKDFASSAGTAQADVKLALGQAKAAADATSQLAGQLQQAADDMPEGQQGKEELSQAAKDMAASSANLQAEVDSLSALNDSLGETSQAVLDASNSLDAYTRQSVDAAQAYSDELFNVVLPTVNSSLAQLATTCSDLSAAVEGQQGVIRTARLALDQIDTVLSHSQTALSQTDGLMADMQSDLDVVAADMTSIAESGLVAQLVENGTLNSKSISDFMGSPTELETVSLYPLNAYGSGMAPLFMNLTFWIGAFMLMVIMRLEVDSEGVPGITLWQRYLSRFIMLGGMVALQAVICCAGVLYLGVHAENAPALFVGSVAAALAYFSLIYALSVTMQHIGKGLCIVLVFFQIPGASGIYPIELTSPFFQAVYPFFPFTYGIDAMREGIGGLYGSNFSHDLTVLGAIFVLSLLLGILLQPLMSNVNRMVAGQVRESDLFNGEDVMTPARPYRFSQVLRVLSDRDEFRQELLERYGRFVRRYPLFLHAAVILGIGLPVVLVLIFALTPTEKEVILTICLVWLVALMVFLVVVESLRYSFERQFHIEDMSNERLLDFYSARERMVPANIRMTSSGMSASEILTRAGRRNRLGWKRGEEGPGESGEGSDLPFYQVGDSPSEGGPAAWLFSLLRRSKPQDAQAPDGTAAGAEPAPGAEGDADGAENAAPDGSGQAAASDGANRPSEDGGEGGAHA